MNLRKLKKCLFKRGDGIDTQFTKHKKKKKGGTFLKKKMGRGKKINFRLP